MQITGFLQEVKGKETRFGTFYSLVVGGKTYDTGSKFPPKGFTAGDYVSFEVAKNDRGYETIKAGSLSKQQAPAGVSPPTPPAASVIAMDRQDVISRQAALNSALTMVGLIVQVGGIPESKTTTAAQKADQVDAMVMSYMQRFFKLSTGAEYEMAEDDVAAAAGLDGQWKAAE